jgi:Rad3-related DNA helicase
MIEDYFPKIKGEQAEPRPGQMEIIKKIEKAIENGKTNIVLEAGTGTGKSIIAATHALYSGRAYIYTMTKQLQFQYEDDFKESFFLCQECGNEYDNYLDECELCHGDSIKEIANFTPGLGRNNFDCLTLREYNITCDNGECQTGTKCFHMFDDCPYFVQKTKAINAKVTLMNYDYGLAEFNYNWNTKFQKRNLAVFDEAHNIEKKIMQFVELELSYYVLEKEVGHILTGSMRKARGKNKWINELEEIQPKYQKRLAVLNKELSQLKELIEVTSHKSTLKSLNKDKVKLVKEVRGCEQKISKIEDIIIELETNHKDWIIDHRMKHGRKSSTDPADFLNVTFKPLYAHAHANGHLLGRSKVNIFMSATILNYRLFCRWLGIDLKDTVFIRVDSPFDKARRPIFKEYAGVMTYDPKIQDFPNLPHTLPIIKKILDKHPDEKGLIHTNSYKFRDFIMPSIRYRAITHQDSEDRLKILNEFKNSHIPNLVLATPSMTEGVDLPYEDCSFQIIMKVPFPSREDKQITTRSYRDHWWYPYQTVLTFAQAYGRGMRAADDRCTTYVLDEKFEDCLNENNKMGKLLPEFIKEAVLEGGYGK